MIADLASRQERAVGRGQLREAGFTPRMIDGRLAAGHLHPVRIGAHGLRGIYAVGVPQLSLAGLQWAAWLAGGDGAVLARRTAADLRGLLSSSALEIAVPPAVCRRPSGIELLRVALPGEDVETLADGRTCTSWARTVLDIAAVESPKRLALALDRTVTLRLFDMRAMDALLERHPRRAGRRALCAALARMTDDGDRTASDGEAHVLWLVLESDLPRPEVNARLLGFVVDLLWPIEKVVVEVDSHVWHDGPFARKADALRQAALEAAGYHVIRVRPGDDPGRTLARIAAALRSRSKG